MRPIYLLTAGAMALMAGPALAQSADDYVASGGTGIRLSFSGQVNRGVLFTNDGEGNDQFFVDNDNSSTRFRFLGEGDIDDNWTAGINIEIQAESNSTASVTQDQENSTGDFLSERKLEFYFENANTGRLTVGQGDTASNGVSEVDFSGTSVVGYSGVEDSAGGIQFRDGDGNLDGVTTVGAAFSNLDGLSRQDRVRYDTPSMAGFTLSSSVGSQNIYDVAVRYTGEFGGVKLGGAVAYSSDANEDEIINGSLSLLHLNTGLNLTLAGGSLERDDAGDTRDTTFGYIKAGFQTNGLSSMGKSSFAVDYALNDDVIQAGDESTSYGLMAVQHIDSISTDIYAGARNYKLERPGSDFQDVAVLLVGARLKF